MKQLINTGIGKLSTILLIVIMPLASYCFEQAFQTVGDTGILYTPREKPEPRINGPLVYGCHPGHPFLYRIPCQGDRPIRFSVQGLPASLKLDPETGIITGTVPEKGEYDLLIQADNSKGKAERKFKIVSGDKLALTPPMGWNHWYAHYDRITDKMVREAADIMISSGLADVGYQYVNIDDCWMNAPENNDSLRVGPLRDEKGNIIPNRHFPDMKELTNYIHSKGLKAGIYTSPGPLTCGGFAGAYQHEEQDARQFAAWGFDFLKYDWCSYDDVAKRGNSDNKKIPAWVKGTPNLAGYQYPYKLMSDLLKQQDRDIVFNLCQYGMGDVWKWGAEVDGNCWRTGGDLGFELNRIFDVAIKNSKIGQYNKPGEWNDPDYIQIGWIGNANKMGIPEQTPMPKNMQYAYMSLWSLLAAPLIYSGDMSKLDEFTLNVLCNPEVIEVNQDPLGECGFVIEKSKDCFIMVKKLADGSLAIGLFNRGKNTAELTVNLSEVQLSGNQSVRDLWRQKELGIYEKKFSASVPAQGVVMVKISKQ
jgi:alpha-galactosidase